MARKTIAWGLEDSRDIKDANSLKENYKPGSGPSAAMSLSKRAPSAGGFKNYPQVRRRQNGPASRTGGKANHTNTEEEEEIGTKEEGRVLGNSPMRRRRLVWGRLNQTLIPSVIDPCDQS